jgi:ABC-type glycerol-3-phosphate transport system permease component
MATATYRIRRVSNWQKNWPRFWQYVILSVFVLLIFVPIVILVFGALKTRGEMYSRPYTPPVPPRWENFTTILGMSSFWTMLTNSLLVMVGATTWLSTYLLWALCSPSTSPFCRSISCCAKWG